MASYKKINPNLQINKRFGNLTVIDSIYIDQAKGPTFHWVCKCDCGKIINVRNSILEKRVGCHTCSTIIKKRLKNKSLENHGGIKRHIYMSYLKRAKEKNLEFSLSFNELIDLLQQNCTYCGAEPISTGEGYCKGNKIDGEFKKNTIDRIDSLKGYSKDNVVCACNTCNKAKLNYSEEFFLNWINNVYNYQKLKRSSTIPDGSTLK